MSDSKIMRRPDGKAAGVAAAAVATGALACGVCCVLPFALPASILAASGGALAWAGGLYSWATGLAVVVVAAAWAWVGWQSFRTRERPAWSTVATVSLASVVLGAALAWPHLEGIVLRMLR